MPIFDHVCNDCGARFESLVLRDEAIHCTKCESAHVQRVPSVFAISGFAPKSAAPAPAAGEGAAPAQPQVRWGYSDEKKHYGDDEY